MHTSALKTESFAVEVYGAPANLEQVFPAWSRHDRIGIIMFSPLGAVGVSMLHQLAIAAFYEESRGNGLLASLQQNMPELIWYPDYYLFHVGGRYGDFGAMDFLPTHKEVFV